MKSLFKPLLAATVALCTLAAVPAHAQTLEVGGLSLEARGFADALISSQGVFETNAGSAAQALTDASLATWVRSSTPGASIVLAFTDNRVLNGSGDDIALFEVGHEAYEYSQEGFDSLWVTINGQRRLYFTTETTTIVDDHNVNMTRLDLSHFGVAAGATISQLEIGLDYNTRDSLPQLQLVAAIHSVAAPVPEPGALALMLGGLAGLLGLRGAARRRGAL
ncbi:PEP-CTERM sorting domain-containing protein [Aquabacterium sp. OR-4]|uniref:PEP-CTERM sorting domain-containing protein n=1 Tax=Aquabacterium sp. OR-4 TaxID=2978127 RepID=UPI0021B3494E|nr:PEP-CTERM sorting domain-containing protein [Aquabacterium sp. OR-4]MDT7838831.1 PEP-CTERM sorting domain-containing protein [Aquabacterium sp. OR-4]